MKSIFMLREKWKKENWILIGLVGILMLVMAIPDGQKKTEEKKVMSESEKEEDYSLEMEKKLTKILQEMKGVGKVSVMITMSSTSEKIIEKDSEIRKEKGENENYSSIETSVLARNDREEIPYVSKEISPSVEGVLVVADGGDDPVVIKNIIDAVQALFPVEPHKIKVMKQQ